MLPFAVPRDEGRDLIDAGGDALTDGLVDENRRRGGHVQRVRETEHRDADAEVRAVHPLGREAVLFGAQRNRHIARQLHLEVKLFGMRRRRKNLEVARLEPGQRLVGGPLSLKPSFQYSSKS